MVILISCVHSDVIVASERQSIFIINISSDVFTSKDSPRDCISDLEITMFSSLC